MTHNSSVSFKLIHFLLWIKGSHQSPNFEIFQVLCWKFTIFLMSFSKPQVLRDSSVLWKITPLYFFMSNVIYFAQKEPIKLKILRILSAQVKIYQILVIFETINQFFFEFSITLQCMKHKSSTFLAETLYTFNKRNIWKYKLLQVTSYISLQVHGISRKPEVLDFDGFLLSESNIKFQLKKYRRVISHDNEEWCKV